MSTKFVSKNSNYMVVLKPGMEGNRTLGTHSIPGLYVKFQAGIVDVKEEAVIALLRAHPCFGTDFIEVKENEVDPYSDERSDIEPDHYISEVKYGHVEKATSSGKKLKLSPQIKKVIESEALKMIPGLLKSNPKILKDIILGLAAEMKEPKETATKQSTKVTEAPKPIEDDSEEKSK